MWDKLVGGGTMTPEKLAQMAGCFGVQDELDRARAEITDLKAEYSTMRDDLDNEHRRRKQAEAKLAEMEADLAQQVRRIGEQAGELMRAEAKLAEAETRIILLSKDSTDEQLRAITTIMVHQKALEARRVELAEADAKIAAWENAAQQGHPTPCTLGPLCPYCEIDALNAKLAEAEARIARKVEESHEISERAQHFMREAERQ